MFYYFGSDNRDTWVYHPRIFHPRNVVFGSSLCHVSWIQISNYFEMNMNSSLGHIRSHCSYNIREIKSVSKISCRHPRMFVEFREIFLTIQWQTRVKSQCHVIVIIIRFSRLYKSIHFSILIFLELISCSCVYWSRVSLFIRKTLCVYLILHPLYFSIDLR
jgi:hypothetical protein